MMWKFNKDTNKKKIFKKVSFFEKILQLRNKNTAEDTLIVFSMFGLTFFIILLIFGWKIIMEDNKNPVIFLTFSFVMKLIFILFLGTFLVMNIYRYLVDYFFIRTKAREHSILDLLESLYYPKNYKYEFNKVIRNEYDKTEKELTTCILDGDITADELYMKIISKDDIQDKILKEIEISKNLELKQEKRIKDFKDKGKNSLN